MKKELQALLDNLSPIEYKYILDILKRLIDSYEANFHGYIRFNFENGTIKNYHKYIIKR